MAEKMPESSPGAGYRRRIISALPDLVIKSFRINDEGLVNDIVIVNEAHVFRFPKHEWAFEHLRQEGKCLALARQYVQLHLPDWTWYDADFVGYPLISGVPLQRFQLLSLPPSGQHALAQQIGQFLYQLHHIPLAEAAAHEIGPSATNRTLDDWRQLYDDVQRKLFPYLMDFAQQWVRQHFAPLLAAPERLVGDHACFMNGDLGVYHLLYDPQSSLLNGIIDFGTAGIGDPAADFACLIDQYGESFLQLMRPYYPGLEQHLDRARFWAGTMELQWALQGLRRSDPSWYLAHIGRARDVLPMGSAWSQS